MAALAAEGVSGVVAEVVLAATGTEALCMADSHHPRSEQRLRGTRCLARWPEAVVYLEEVAPSSNSRAATVGSRVGCSGSR